MLSYSIFVFLMHGYLML